MLEPRPRTTILTVLPMFPQGLLFILQRFMQPNPNFKVLFLSDWCAAAPARLKFRNTDESSMTPNTIRDVGVLVWDIDRFHRKTWQTWEQKASINYLLLLKIIRANFVINHSSMRSKLEILSTPGA